jgi:maleylpyruvate isomerase
MRLYSYYRSSAAWRVRIALNLKNLAYETVPVHLLKNEQQAPDYASRNAQKLIPTLALDDQTLGQSLAIIEYLEETHPHPPLLPKDPLARARLRQIACTIACDIHPINNLRVLRYLKDQWQIDEAARAEWQRHWMSEGLAAIETLLAQSPLTGAFCYGERPGLADLCLIPQLYNARRNELDLAPYQTILRIEEACSKHPAFAAAHPKNQPDAEMPC